MTDITTLLQTTPSRLDASCWQAALTEARSVLADLAVGRCAGRFRVTEHDVRMAFDPRPAEARSEPAFSWSARTARRAIGLAAVRLLLHGRARSPLDAVRTRTSESAQWVREGCASTSQLDRWIADLSEAGRAAVEAEAVTWATRLWCAVDWAALETPPVIGRDRWWDSPHSALLALRGRAELRTPVTHLVVLSGARRESVRSELSLVVLVEALRSHKGDPPARVLGWWPESGHLVRVEPEPVVLRDATDAVALVLAGGGGPLRAAA